MPTQYKTIIHSDFLLKNHNTFHIQATAKAFAEVDSVEVLKGILKENQHPIQILGGGSNVLFTKEYYNALFIKNSIKGIKIIEENATSVVLEIGSGEGWHDLVMWAVAHDYGGIENLSLIPGTVGASPIQNIGAYGVELKDIFVKLEALNLQTFEIQYFTNEQCQFGYRDSIFKKEIKGQYFITKVFLKLTQSPHRMSTQYGDISKILQDKNIEKPTIKDISGAVIQIRQSKLPDPSVLGNAGSFFKNPEIPIAQFQTLKEVFPNIVGYNTEGGVKVAAGWLIEQSGWKGKRVGDVGVHERQALVLVNYGGGEGSEIKALSEQIQASVKEKFGIDLMAEVNIL
jgi:UDP-N-acetylmuramate dehydrogenase